VLLKLASVGYRFVRYYSGEPHYRAAGPPALAMRLLGPVVVLLTLVLFGSGIALWRVGYSLPWVALHNGSFVLWAIAMAVHLAAYLRPASALAARDWRDRLRGALARRSLVVASLVLGAALAIAMLPFPTPDRLLPGQ
jgi:hypothetical protein